MEGVKALLGSEKAIAGGILIICATVLTAIGMMTVADWQSYSQSIFITYVAGKTVQGGVAMWTEAKKAPTVTESKITKTEQKTEQKTEDVHVNA